ncbi:MAG: hypothetical protein ACREBG_16395, partial [Pyrinomonadaceae bacterium]
THSRGWDLKLHHYVGGGESSLIELARLGLGQSVRPVTFNEAEEQLPPAPRARAHHVEATI